MSLCDQCNYRDMVFKHACAYESKQLRINALTTHECQKFAVYLQTNGDSNEQIINFTDFDVVSVPLKRTDQMTNKGFFGNPIRNNNMTNEQQLIEMFEEWKAYPLPAMDNEGRYPHDWMNREFIAFKAGIVSAHSITSMQTNSHFLDAADKAIEDLNNGLFDDEINAIEPAPSVTSMQGDSDELLTELERSGLEAHHLPTETKSQLSDSFRLGVTWAMRQLSINTDGWVSVPIEPTEEMLKALDDALREWASNIGCYRAMIAASPRFTDNAISQPKGESK